MSEILRHPVQTYRYRRGQSWAPVSVTMAAYEVYTHLYGEQEALITGGCRGGFGANELIAFLYARAFPKLEWSLRVNEALKGMENI